MNKYIFSLICFFFMMALPMNAQSESSTKVYYEVDEVDEMPSFPGGKYEQNVFIAQNLKYPLIDLENGVQGRVLITFIVETDGSITDVKVARSVDPYIDKEAMRIVKAMPKWTPGKQDGKPVRVKYRLPVVFHF